MAHRIPRRRALARWLTLLSGITLSTPWWSPSMASAQSASDSSSEPPDTETLPVVPAGPGDDLMSPVVDATEEEAPPDVPPPVAVAPGPWGVPPIKLMIPALGVESAVEAVGVDPDGAMSTPTDPDDVAWYQPGPGMGVPGNAVFAAHVNWDGRLRPFGQLHLLGVGDAIQVVDAEGRGFEYVVESSHWVRAEGAPLDEIFAQPSTPVVTLITCGGEYIAATREYLDRLIVKAKGA